MAIDFNDGNRKILAVNIYMPCDDRSTTSLNYDEFIKYLGLVDAIIKESYISSVFVIGDWNAGVNNNSVFGSELSTFCTEHTAVVTCFPMSTALAVAVTHLLSLVRPMALRHG